MKCINTVWMTHITFVYPTDGIWEYEVCSNSIWIGTVDVVHWVGCVCNQLRQVRTRLSNSWRKIQVAAFAQLAVVGHGSNTCVYVLAIFTMFGSTEKCICITFCFKIGKTATETYQLLQQAYGEDAMGCTQEFDWFHRFKEGRTSVLREPRSGRLWTWRNEEMIAKVRTMVSNNGRLTVQDRSCDVCVNQFAENGRKCGGMATGSCTTTVCQHTLHILCSSFWPNTAPLSCSSRLTHQISHRWTFSYSQGLRKFWKDTDLRQRRTSNEIRRRHY